MASTLSLHSRLFSLAFCLVVGFAAVEAQSFQYVFDASLPGINLTSECSTALTSNISCNSWVSRFRPGQYYDPKGLQEVCTATCQSAIQGYTSALASSCTGLTYNYTDNTLFPVSAIGSRLLYNYDLVCMQDSGRFCNYVAYEASLQADPDAPAILGRPTSNETISPCDTCIVKHVQLEAGSPFDGGEALASDYSSLTSSCSITGMPISTTPLSSSTIPPTTSAPAPTCSGKTYKVVSTDTCRSIAESQGISVGWLVMDNGLDAYCANFKANGSLCLQNTCQTYTVKAGDTCRSIASAANVTAPQVISWNPIFDQTCSNIARSVNDTVCISKPGRPYATPSATIPVATSLTTAVPVPTDVAANTTHTCGLFYAVQEGDYCNLVCLRFGIHLDDFLFLNPSVNSNCTNLLAHESYCVAPVGDLTSYPGYPGYVPPVTSTPASAWSSAPKATWTPAALNLPGSAPLAAGTRSDCWSFTDGAVLQVPINGTFYSSVCQLMAAAYGVTLEQLQNWNPSLDTASPECAFDPAARYCLLAYNPTETGGNGPSQSATADPIRGGTWSNCTAYLDVNFGMTCQDILANYDLTIAQFSAWNPAVGAQCENLWLGYSYCVSLTRTLDEAGGGGGGGGGGAPPGDDDDPTGTSTVGPSPTMPPGGPAAPSPTQADSIAANCDEYAQAGSGDGCYSFADRNGISADQLYAWNKVLGDGGANCDTQFWLGYYYCVGVSG